MAGGLHRKNEAGKYELTPEARENNRFLAQLYAIMRWAKSKNPHLIVVIENPVGLLRKKPTHLWTNDFKLHSTLSEYRCETKCPYFGGIHPVGARANGHQFNAAAIPEALAEEVADEVHSRFQDLRIRKTPEATMTEEEIEAFNKLMTASGGGDNGEP
eukprot:CAMPEP_0178774030 /NCGR_PEP_ID=MMETSP0744-20121128/23417_1 /TAXON_ID=913974 /ORGANISM="Nitzschia punctata, Strain CCMP561" /LENGTH=157 /DNA_ID=CAMNT_0020430865 /DNA_START=8 /DNA_END=481 /DNA_ORIENTATION=+